MTPDANGTISDIFVYDTVTHTATSITDGGNGLSIDPSISADGSRVVFTTYSTNLEEGVTHTSLGNTDVAFWYI